MSFMTRTQQREYIFKLLFQIDFISKKEINEHISIFLDNLHEVSKDDKEAIKDRFLKALPYVLEIDDLLNSKVTGWKTNRMNKVDLSILRLAIYEMKYDDEVPVGVAIDEAVELAKKFSSKNGPSFVNGVLAKIVKED